MQKTIFQHVLSKASLLEQKKTLCGLRRGKALLGKFLEVRGERKKLIIKFSVSL